MYDNDRKPDHRIEIITTIRGEDARALFTRTERRARTESKEKSAVFRHAMTIPLAGMQPGPFLLIIDVSSTNAARRAARGTADSVHRPVKSQIT